MEQKNNGADRTPEASGPEVKPEVRKEPPKSAPQRELTTAQLQKRRKMIVFPLFFLVFAGCVWLIFAPSDKEDEQAGGQSGFNAELPVPKDEGIVGDKRTAYEQESQRQREESKMRSLQDLSDMFEQQTGQGRQEDERQLQTAPDPAEYYENPALPADGDIRQAGTSVNSSASAYNDINRQLGAWYEQPRDEQAQQQMQQRMEELEHRLEEAEARKAAEDDQLALLEKSYELAARYVPGSAGQAAPDGEATAAGSSATGGQSGKVIAQPVKQVRQNVVSLLAAPMPDKEFIETYSQPRNLGFLTAAGNEGVQDKNSIRACVYQTVTLTNGKEMQIRLLEPMRAGDILIPANTIVTGACRIGGERMDVTITSIQYADNIIPVELLVYDTDGQRGIFVPNSDEVKAAKEVAATLANSAGSSIMISDNAGSQLAADVGKGLIQGASQYVSKKMSVVKVTVKANYRLLLLPKTQ